MDFFESINSANHQLLTTQQLLLITVRISYISVILGRCWQMLVGNFPLFNLLWDEKLLKPLIEKKLNSSWQFYLQWSEPLITLILTVGSFFGLMAAVYTLASREAIKTTCFITLYLIFIAFLYWKEKNYEWIELGEYGAQCISPVVHYYFYKYQRLSTEAFYGTLIAIAITFAAHGSYALDLFPRPALFMDMTLYILPLTQEQGILFLRIVGCLDIIAAGGILYKRLRTLSLFWMIQWGLATTLARLSLIQTAPNLWVGLYENLHEILIRLCHFLLPFFIWLYEIEYHKPIYKAHSSL